jgi:hypothetical protein
MHMTANTRQVGAVIIVGISGRDCARRGEAIASGCSSQASFNTGSAEAV